MPRFFLAHPKDEPKADRLAEDLADLLRVEHKLVVEVITGAKDYEQNFHRYGGWDGWTASVATGNEYRGTSLGPRFDAIVVSPDVLIGKATASIVNMALKMRKPVYFYDGGKKLSAVAGATRISGNFSKGWQLF